MQRNSGIPILHRHPSISKHRISGTFEWTTSTVFWATIINIFLVCESWKNNKTAKIRIPGARNLDILQVFQITKSIASSKESSTIPAVSPLVPCVRQLFSAHRLISGAIGRQSLSAPARKLRSAQERQKQHHGCDRRIFRWKFYTLQLNFSSSSSSSKDLRPTRPASQDETGWWSWAHSLRVYVCVSVWQVRNFFWMHRQKVPNNKIYR